MRYFLAALAAWVCVAGGAGAQSVQRGVAKGAPVDTNTVAGRTEAARAQDRFNVKDAPYGAKGDALVGFTDGVISSGSTAFSSASASFTQADVGKTIILDGVGASGAPLVTTISSVNSANSILLASPAQAAMPVAAVNGMTLSSPGTGYVPGSTLTFQIPTGTTAATALLKFTQVATASVASAGTGGTTGACILTGTTGTQLGASTFTVNATITSGAISSLGSIISAGIYSANPTVLTAEPVTSNCGLTGATLSLGMGVLYATNLSAGQYPSVPSTAVSVTSSGSGTGAQFLLKSSLFSWAYGTNDTAAFSAAYSASSAGAALGQPTCLYVPASTYLVAPSASLITKNFCVVGDGSYKTTLTAIPNVAGDMFPVSENWVGAANTAPSGGSTFYVKNSAIGPMIEGITVIGYRTSSINQNALMLYDRNDNAVVVDFEARNMRGRCFAAGLLNAQTSAYMRETHHFHAVRCWADGDAGYPVFEINSAGSGDASNEIDLNGIDIYSSYGLPFVIRNQATVNSVRQIRGSQIRVEGLESNPYGMAFPNFQIGDATQSGGVSNIDLQQIEAISVPTGFPGVEIMAQSVASEPSRITIQGTIPSGAYGRGLEVDGGTNISLHFSNLVTNDYNLVVGPSTYIGQPIRVDGDGAETSWTSSIDSTSATLVYHPVISSFRGTQFPGVSLNAADNKSTGGNARGNGAVDLQMARGSASQIASGGQAFIGAGSSNLASAFQSGIVAGLANATTQNQAFVGGGQSNAVNGTQAGIVAGLSNVIYGLQGFIGGGSAANDHTRLASQCFASGSVFGTNGGSQACRQVLYATGAAAMRLTAGGGSVSSTNVFNISLSTAISFSVRLTAYDRTTPANTYSWTMPIAELIRASGSPSLSLGTASTLSTGTGSTASVSATADTTNNGLNITFTPPSGTDTWDAVADVNSVEAQ